MASALTATAQKRLDWQNAWLSATTAAKYAGINAAHGISWALTPFQKKDLAGGFGNQLGLTLGNLGVTPQNNFDITTAQAGSLVDILNKIHLGGIFSDINLMA